MSLPPAGLAPAELLRTWLPATYAASGRRAPANAPVVRVSLSGPDGGDFNLHATEQGLIVEPDDRRPGARGQDPGVWLRQSVADFVATFEADPDLPPILPPGWGALDLLFLDPRDVELIQRIDGRILIEIAGKRRRRWAMDIAFGKSGVNAGRPRSTVRLDGATYDRLRTRTAAPLQALLEGRVKLEGDRTLAMQALVLVAARLQRS